MLPFFKKNAILSIILGLVLIILGILFVFIMPEIGENIKDIAIGLMILALMLVLVIPDLQKRKQRLVRALLVIELVIALIVATMFMTGSGSNPSLWIGLVLYVHGLFDLISGYFGGSKQKLERFIISIVLLTLGVYIFASGLITEAMLLNVLLILFIAPGLFLCILGALQMSKRTKKVKA